MATYKVRAPDGSIIKLNGPDGASEETILQAAAAAYAQRASRPLPADEAISTIPGADGATAPYVPPSRNDTTATDDVANFAKGAASSATKAVMPIFNAMPSAMQFINRLSGGAGLDAALRDAGAVLGSNIYIPESGAAKEASRNIDNLAFALGMNKTPLRLPASVGEAGAGAKNAAASTWNFAKRPKTFGGQIKAARSVGAAELPARARRLASARNLKHPLMPTEASVSGDAQIWQKMDDLARRNDIEASRAINERHEFNIGQVHRNFDDMIDRTAGDTSIPLGHSDVGAAVRRALIGQNNAERAAVNSLYNAARLSEASGDTRNLHSLISGLGREANTSDWRALIAEVKRLGVPVDSPVNLSANDLELVRRSIAGMAGPTASDNARRVAKMAKNALDMDLDAIGDKAYRAARAAHAARKGRFEGQSAIGGLLEQPTKGRAGWRVADEDVLKSVLRKPERDIRVLVDRLGETQEGQDALRAMRAKAIADLQDRVSGTNPLSSGGRNLIPSQLVSSASKNNKLRTLLGNELTSNLDDLAEAVKIHVMKPANTYGNYSNTGAFLERIFDRGGAPRGLINAAGKNVPLLNIATDAFGDAVRARRNEALVDFLLNPTK